MTVTYETSATWVRRSRAALVLIYMLVVGMFGNFLGAGDHHGADPADPARHRAGSLCRPDSHRQERVLHLQPR